MIYKNLKTIERDETKQEKMMPGFIHGLDNNSSNEKKIMWPKTTTHDFINVGHPLFTRSSEIFIGIQVMQFLISKA